MPEESESKLWYAFKDTVAGGIGGIGLVAVGHPFDTIKVRIQTQPADNPIYKGTLDCVRKTQKLEGLKGFYKGCASPLVGQIFYNAVQFLAFGQVKQAMIHGPRLSIKESLVAGAVTGVAVTFVECPMDFLKSQIQVQAVKAQSNPEYKPQFKGVADCAKQVFKTNGLLGVFQGFLPTLYRDTIAVSLYFGSYEWVRRAYRKPGQSLEDIDKQGPWIQFLAGGIAGFFYWIGIYPLDVIKSTLQCDSIAKSERTYKGMMDITKKIWNTQGMKGFFKGFVPCMLRSIPANAACFLFVEQTKKIMG
ncbi:hypothetical protein WA158_004887 [Blastocystis sp. Blastoise]